MYKVGDTVVIKSRIGFPEDYPYTYTDGMAEHCGEKAKIIDIEICSNSFAYRRRRYFNHDRYMYYLDITKYLYIWSSSMFFPYFNSSNFVPLSGYV